MWLVVAQKPRSFAMGKKVPCVPPIFHNNKCITELREIHY